MEYDVPKGCLDMDRSSWMIGDRAQERALSAGARRRRRRKACKRGKASTFGVLYREVSMQLHSANDQWTAHVNMAFSRPQNYDFLQCIGASGCLWFINSDIL